MPVLPPISRRQLWLYLSLTIALLKVACAGSGWELRNKPVACNVTDDVTYAANRWVGVGEDGKVITSANGSDWITLPPITENNLHAVTHDGTRFVACGDNGTVISSPDGLVWQIHETGTDTHFLDITFGAGRFVLTGQTPGPRKPRFHSSADLLTWTTFETEGKYTTGSGSAPNGKVVVRGSDRFIVPFPGNQAFVSTDGIEWTLVTTQGITFTFPSDGCYHAGRYYVIDSIGRFAYSVDGTNWTQIPTGYPTWVTDVNGLLVDGDRIIVTSVKGFYTSTNHGAQWTYRSYGFLNPYPGCNGVGFGGGRYLVMPNDGTALPTATFEWATDYPGRAANDFLDVCHANGTFVAGGRPTYTSDGVIWSSPDGVTWAQRWTGETEVHGICYGNGKWVAVGVGPIITSTNLTTWTERGYPPGALSKVIFAQGLFVAIGGGYVEPQIMTSPDGVTWTSRVTNARGPLLSIAYANGRFVAVGSHTSGNAGEIITSTDGITWTRSPQEFTKALFSVTYGNSMFLAGGAYGLLLRSETGIDWTVLDPGNGTYQKSWSGLHFTGTRFLGLNEYLSFNGAFTTDGITWTPQMFGVPDLRAATHGEGKIVAVGAGDHILSMADLPLPAAPTSFSANSASLSWNQSPSAKGYRILRRAPGTVRWEDAAPPLTPQRTSKLLDGLKQQTAYEFAIQSITANGLSEISRATTTTFNGQGMWRVIHFGNEQNAGPGENNADPDSDGYPNLIEYALGGNPHTADPSRLLEESIGMISGSAPGDPRRKVTMAFPVDPLKTSINVYLESGSNLASWTRFAQSTGGGSMKPIAGQTGVGVMDYHYNGNTRVRNVTVSREFPGAGAFVRVGVEER